jgi:hypothetical protein
VFYNYVIGQENWPVGVRSMRKAGPLWCERWCMFNDGLGIDRVGINDVDMVYLFS